MNRLVKNALKNGIYIIVNSKLEFDFIKRPRFYYSDDFKCWCFEICFGAYIVKLKDYKKTWALKKKDLEVLKEYEPR